MIQMATVQQYIQEVKVEAKKVVWPDGKETFQATLLVLAMVIFVALFLWLVDMSMSSLVKLIY